MNAVNTNDNLVSKCEAMQAINDYAHRFFQDQLWNTEEGQDALQFLTVGRELDESTIRHFQIGYAPINSVLGKKMVEAGFQEELLLNDMYSDSPTGTGICYKSPDGRLYDRFCGRIIFPFFSRSGKVIGFAGRIVKHRKNVGKYIYSPDSPLFSKRNILYGLYHALLAINRMDECILVEGQLDVISLYQAGIDNVVCSGGTCSTESQLRLIKNLTNNLTLIFDGDMAGLHASLRVTDMFLKEQMNLRVVIMPENTDPDEFVRTHPYQDVLDYISNNKLSFVQFKYKVLNARYGNDLYNRAQIIKDICNSISLFHDDIVRRMAIREASELFMLDESIVENEVVNNQNCRPYYHEPYYKVREPEPPKVEPQIPIVQLTEEEASKFDYEDGSWLVF